MQFLGWITCYVREYYCPVTVEFLSAALVKYRSREDDGLLVMGRKSEVASRGLNIAVSLAPSNQRLGVM